jgi:hypothetical protein
VLIRVLIAVRAQIRVRVCTRRSLHGLNSNLLSGLRKECLGFLIRHVVNSEI